MQKVKLRMQIINFIILEEHLTTWIKIEQDNQFNKGVENPFTYDTLPAN